MKDSMPEPCAEWRDKLAARHPNDLTPEEQAALQTHLVTCANCRTVYAVYQKLERQLHALFAAPSAADAFLYTLKAPRARRSAFLEQDTDDIRIVPLDPERQHNQRRRSISQRAFTAAGIVLAALVVLALVTSFLLQAARVSHKSNIAATPSYIGAVQTADHERIGLSDGRVIFDTNRPDGKLKQAAAIQLRAGNLIQAERLFQQAVTLEPSDAEAHIYLADTRILAAHQSYETVIIGAMLAGSYIGVGHDDLQGAYIAQQQFNTHCLLPHCMQIRLLIANVGSGTGTSDEAAFATTVSNQIVQAAQADKSIVGVVGFPFSVSSLSAVDILAPYHIPMVASTASADQLTGRSPYFFRVAPTNNSEAIVGAKYAITSLHARRVAIFVDPTNEYSNSLATDFVNQYTALGGKIVATEQFTTGASNNMPTLLNNALQSSPDLIYFSGYIGDINPLLTSLPTTGAFAHLQVLGGDALYELSEYTPNALNAFNRLHFTAFAYPDEWGALGLGAQQPAFFQDYAHTFSRNSANESGLYGYTRPENDTILNFDAMQTMLTAMRTALQTNTTLNGTDVQIALTHITGTHALQGVSGQIAFGPDGNPINKAVLVLSVNAHRQIQFVSLWGDFLAPKK